jgi:hypothetical protein
MFVKLRFLAALTAASALAGGVTAEEYNELQAPVCAMAEILAQQAIMYRILNKPYAEALEEQRIFMSRTKWPRRDANIGIFINRVGLELVDKAYGTPLPKISQDENSILYYMRRWAQKETTWCR